MTRFAERVLGFSLGGVSAIVALASFGRIAEQGEEASKKAKEQYEAVFDEGGNDIPFHAGNVGGPLEMEKESEWHLLNGTFHVEYYYTGDHYTDRRVMIVYNSDGDICEIAEINSHQEKDDAYDAIKEWEAS